MSEYNDDGRCVSTEIIVVICSPGEHTGAPDVSTQREYKFYCPKCRSFRFKEENDFLYCVGCDNDCGYLYEEEGMPT